MKFIRFGDHAVFLHDIKMMRVCQHHSYQTEAFVVMIETGEGNEIPSASYRTHEEASKALDDFIALLNTPPWPRQCDKQPKELNVQFESE